MEILLRKQKGFHGLPKIISYEIIYIKNKDKALCELGNFPSSPESQLPGTLHEG